MRSDGLFIRKEDLWEQEKSPGVKDVACVFLAVQWRTSSRKTARMTTMRLIRAFCLMPAIGQRRLRNISTEEADGCSSFRAMAEKKKSPGGVIFLKSVLRVMGCA